MTKEEFDNFKPDPGWKRVTGDEWAEYTSDYNTYSTERMHKGLDTMMCRVSTMGATIDVSCVHYIRIEGEVQRIYLINEAATELLAPYKRKFYYSAKEE